MKCVPRSRGDEPLAEWFPVECGSCSPLTRVQGARLVQLPPHRWDWGEWTLRNVARNCHVAIERYHYFGPAAYIGRTVEVLISERMIEVFLERGGDRIAVHRRKKKESNRYVTQPEYMPKRFNSVRDIRNPDYGDFLLGQARAIGANASAWAARCFASKDFPEQAFTTVQGMISPAEKHGFARLDALCVEALALELFASGFLRDRLRNGGEPEPLRPEHTEAIPDHINIRGGTFYSKTREGERRP